jgi:hypothetical protein
MSGKQFLRMWQGVLDSLTADADEQTQEILSKMQDMPAQPKATWKRLLQDMQVRGPPVQTWVGQHMHTSQQVF